MRAKRLFARNSLIRQKSRQVATNHRLHGGVWKRCREEDGVSMDVSPPYDDFQWSVPADLRKRNRDCQQMDPTIVLLSRMFFLGEKTVLFLKRDQNPTLLQDSSGRSSQHADLDKSIIGLFR
jgi:hypothetical protein